MKRINIKFPIEQFLRCGFRKRKSLALKVKCPKAGKTKAGKLIKYEDCRVCEHYHEVSAVMLDCDYPEIIQEFPEQRR